MMSRIAPSAAFVSIPTEDLGQRDRVNLGFAPKLAIHLLETASPAWGTT
jgi:hypothetical protein